VLGSLLEVFSTSTRSGGHDTSNKQTRSDTGGVVLFCFFHDDYRRSGSLLRAAASKMRCWRWFPVVPRLPRARRRAGPESRRGSSGAFTSLQHRSVNPSRCVLVHESVGASIQTPQEGKTRRVQAQWHAISAAPTASRRRRRRRR
jgi:hypothetical protein